MRLIYADIELMNSNDLALNRIQIIGEKEIKRITANMLVDTGKVYLYFNENIQTYLQLPFLERRRSVLAKGDIVTLDIIRPIDIRFKNRRRIISATVLPGNSEPLLGAIAMEYLDVCCYCS